MRNIYTNIYIYIYIYTHINTHTMKYYSAIKIIKSCLLCNMDGPGGYHAKWNKSDREIKYHMISLIFRL